LFAAERADRPDHASAVLGGKTLLAATDATAL
jgi:hypothetical protein